VHRKILIAAACAVLTLQGTLVPAENPNPRIGKWKLKSTTPPPSSNVMTYEHFGKDGMKITIDAVDKDGIKSQWYYTTNFDGKDEPITGNPGADSGAVRIITPSINEIVYKKNGKVSQILTNVLSPDHNTIGIIYMRQGAEGQTTSVTFATYERIQ
jgi:hypothetical protein